MIDCLSRHLRRAGLQVDTERVVPDLARKSPNGDVVDAILDVVATIPGSPEQALVDVATRCPHAARDAHAAQCAGSTAGKAQFEKIAKYGDSVHVLTYETYGRLGEAGAQALEALAMHAAAVAQDRLAVPRLLQLWRGALERAVLFAQSDVFLLSLGANVNWLAGQ